MRFPMCTTFEEIAGEQNGGANERSKTQSVRPHAHRTIHGILTTFPVDFPHLRCSSPCSSCQVLCVRTALAAGRGWEVQLDAGGRYARGCSAPLGNLRGSLRGQRPPSLSSDSTVFTLPRRCAVVHGGFCFFVARFVDKYVSPCRVVLCK